MKDFLLRSVCRQNLKMKVSRDLVDYVKRERGARAARFFFLIQPIKSMIYDVVVAILPSSFR